MNVDSASYLFLKNQTGNITQSERRDASKEEKLKKDENNLMFWLSYFDSIMPFYNQPGLCYFFNNEFLFI